MPALVADIDDLFSAKTWMAGTGPAMTLRQIMRQPYPFAYAERPAMDSSACLMHEFSPERLGE
jgi:hypothetical protein